MNTIIRKNALVKQCPSVIPALALLVTVIMSSAYLAPINKGIPGGGWFFTLFHLVMGLTIIPYIIELIPMLAKPEWQLAVALFAATLGWVSLLEDKSRYSEDTTFCLTSALPESWSLGTCRKNALVTGVLAHVADVIGIYLIGSSLIENQSAQMYWLFRLIMFIYTVAGIYYIWKLTEDKGPSDIREYTEKTVEMDDHFTKLNDDYLENDPSNKEIMDTYEELKNTKNQPRLWTDFNRGTLNLIITYLGMLAAWQVIFNEIPGFQNNCLTWSGLSTHHLPGVFPLKRFWDAISSKDHSIKRTFEIIILIFTFVLPNNGNLINTSYQYSAPSKEVGLKNVGNLNTSS